MIVNSNPGKYLAALVSRTAAAAYREIQEKTMTKTTEELKREMYGLISELKKLSDSQSTYTATYAFEEVLEAYLESLRQDATSESQRLTETIRYNAVLSDAYAHQQGLTHAACVEARQAWDETYEWKGKVQGLQAANDSGCHALVRLQEERDELRNKLQAFEFANKSAGEFLVQARAKVHAQRQSIGKLKNERDNAVHALKVRTSQRDGLEAQLLEARKKLSELRNIEGSTSAQSSAEVLPETKRGALLPYERRTGADQCAHSTGIAGHCIYCRKKLGARNDH